MLSSFQGTEEDAFLVTVGNSIISLLLAIYKFIMTMIITKNLVIIDQDFIIAIPSIITMCITKNLLILDQFCIILIPSIITNMLF